MKDSADVYTADLIQRRRGRPPKPDALSNAERQQRYRERHRRELAELRPANLRDAGERALSRWIAGRTMTAKELQGAAAMLHQLGLIDIERLGEWQAEISAKP